MAENNDSGVTIVGKIAIFFACVVYIVAIRGFVYSTLWAWFVFGTLSNYQLPVWQAAGLALFVGKPANQPKDDKRGEFEKTLMVLGSVTLYAVISLSVGWVLTFFR